MRRSASLQDALGELLPLAAGVLVPPGYELGDEYEFFGYTSRQQAEFAYSAHSRLKVIGVGLPVAAWTTTRFPCARANPSASA
jgi:hypothetical protein